MQFQIRPDLPSVKTSSGEKTAESSVKGGAWRECQRPPALPVSLHSIWVPPGLQTLHWTSECQEIEIFPTARRQPEENPTSLLLPHCGVPELQHVMDWELPQLRILKMKNETESESAVEASIFRKHVELWINNIG